MRQNLHLSRVVDSDSDSDSKGYVCMNMSIADAIIYGSPEDVAREAHANASLDFVDEYGYTPLIQACISDDIALVNILLKYNPDVNFADLVGQTALHWAVDNHNLELCTLLLKRGANPNAYSVAGMPILVKPLLRDQKELKELLIQQGAQLTFAYDFINAKLLGHRFELTGYVDIINASGEFIEIGLEGFILEFTTALVKDALYRFISSFSTRHLRHEFQSCHRSLLVVRPGWWLKHEVPPRTNRDEDTPRY